MDRRFLPLLFALLLAACGDQPAQQWTLATKGAFSAALSPNGQYATVGAIEHGGSLWRLSDGERLYNWNHTQGTYSMLVASTFSTDSRFVITAEKNAWYCGASSLADPAAFGRWMAASKHWRCRMAAASPW